MSKDFKYYLFIILIFISNCLYALDGNIIVKNAEQYRDHKWKCNDWNARTSNADAKIDNNDLRYPFYPDGAKYMDKNGIPRTSDGWHIGIAYGWGLRETENKRKYQLI
jgi:hypothetical protein